MKLVNSKYIHSENYLAVNFEANFNSEYPGVIVEIINVKFEFLDLLQKQLYYVTKDKNIA